MNVLVFDTCFDACSAAAVRSGAVAAARFEPMAQGHAERLVPMIAEVMAEAGLAFAALDRIGVTTGPGSFAGTRIGVAAARAFALTHRVPLVGLSPLAVMAAQAGGQAEAAGAAGRPVLVAVDVRRGEAYCQLFEPGGRIALDAPQLMGFATVAGIAARCSAWVVGSAAQAIAGLAGPQGTCRAGLPELRPDAQHAVTLVQSSLETTATVAPLYLRAADAKPPASAALERYGPKALEVADNMPQ